MGTGNELILAGETLERMAMQYEGMVTAAAALKGIGSIENHLQELTVKRDSLLSDTERIMRENERTHDALLATREAITAALDEAQAAAALAQERFIAESEAIITRANEAAAVVKAAAEAEAKAIVTKANETADEAFEHLQFLLVSADKAREGQRVAEDARDAAQAKYDDIQAMIHAMTESNR